MPDLPAGLIQRAGGETVLKKGDGSAGRKG